MDISTFTGRDDQLTQLKVLLIDKKESRVCSIVGLSGGGGIGKSALASHFATEYKHCFPDGVIGLRVDGEDKDVNKIARDFIRKLYEYTEQELDPEDERDPAVLMQEAFGHRRMLLIFDNADDPEILQPLIEAVSQSAVVVTTRDRGISVSLNIAEESIIDVPLLPTDDSLLLLKRVIGEDRVNAEIDAAYEIVQLVENLPLALSIAASFLKLHNRRSLGDYAISLREEKKRLSRLKLLGDEPLRASFQLSLELLLPEEIRFFACLSVCGRNSFSRMAAAAAAGLEDEYDAHQFLDPLYRLSLVNYAEAGENRFTLHSLIRLFAQEIAEKEGLIQKAKEKHASFFVSFIKEKDLSQVIIAQQIAEDFDDVILAINWLQTQENPEYNFYLDLFPIFQKFGYWEKAVVLMKGFQQLAEIKRDWNGVVQFRIQQAKYLNLLHKTDDAKTVLDPVEGILPQIEVEVSRLRCKAMWLTTLKGIYVSQGLMDDAVKVARQAAALDEQLAQPYKYCISLNALAAVLQQRQQFEEATEVLQRAVEVAEQHNNLQQLRISLSALSNVLQQQQCFEEAIEVLQKAGEVAEQLDDLHSLSICLIALGNALQQQQRFEEAIEVLQRAGEVAEQLDNFQQLSISLNALGNALQQQQQFEEAINVLQRAVEVAEQLDNLQSLRISLTALGNVLQHQQRFDEAIEVMKRAVEVAEQLDNLQSLRICLTALSNVLQHQQRFDEAIEILQRAAEVAEKLNDLRGLSFSLNFLGNALQQQGRFEEAIEALQKAVEVSEKLDNLQSLNISLSALGSILQQQERFEEAIEALQKAVEVSERLDNLQELSFSLNVLGRVLQQQERFEEAIEVLQKAAKVAEKLDNLQSLNISLSALGHVLQQQERFEETIEALQRVVEVAEHLNDLQELAISLNVLGRVLQQQERFEEAIEALQRAVEVAEKLNDLQQRRISLTILGNILQQQERFGEAIVALQKVVEVAKQIDDLQSLSISLNALGNALQQQQRFDEAIEVFQKFVEVATQSNDPQTLAIAFSLQGRALQLNRQPNNAEIVLLRGLEIAEDLDDFRSLSIVLNTLGGVYKDLSQWQNSEYYFRRCFDLAYKEKNITGQAIALNGLGQVLEKQGGEKFDIALAAFRKSIQLGEQENNQAHLAKVHTAMGQALIRKERPEEAVCHLKKAFELDIIKGNQRGVSLIITYLSQSLIRCSQHDEAVQYVQRSLEIFPNHQGILNLYQRLTGSYQPSGIYPIKQGIVKHIRKTQTDNRYGHIAPADGSRDIYFREGFIPSQIIDLLDTGTLVEVEVKQQENGPCAESICVLPDIGKIT